MATVHPNSTSHPECEKMTATDRNVEYGDKTLATLSNGLVTILVTSYITGLNLLYFVSRLIL